VPRVWLPETGNSLAKRAWKEGTAKCGGQLKMNIGIIKWDLRC
jgi:hypothetical protein